MTRKSKKMNFHPSVLQSARINAAAASTSDCISKKTGVVTDAIEKRRKDTYKGSSYINTHQSSLHCGDAHLFTFVLTQFLSSFVAIFACCKQR